jgi:hypothetical protein
MGRIIIICLAVLTMQVVVFTTLAKAQQTGPIEAAMAAAAGPEFCPRTPCPGFVLKRSVSPTVPKPAGQPKTGPFPPQPYQSSRSEPRASAQTDLPSLKTNVGKTPSSLNLSGDDKVRAPRPNLGAYSPQLEARSLRMFPYGSQEQERQQWMADQEQRGIANDINRTKPLLYPVSGR